MPKRIVYDAEFAELERAASQRPDPASQEIFAMYENLVAKLPAYKVVDNLSERTQRIIIAAYAIFSRVQCEYDRLAASRWKLTRPLLIETFGCPPLVSQTFIKKLASLAVNTKIDWRTALGALHAARTKRVQPEAGYRGGGTAKYKEWTPKDVDVARAALVESNTEDDDGKGDVAQAMLEQDDDGKRHGALGMLERSLDEAGNGGEDGAHSIIQHFTERVGKRKKGGKGNEDDEEKEGGPKREHGEAKEDGEEREDEEAKEDRNGKEDAAVGTPERLDDHESNWDGDLVQGTPERVSDSKMEGSHLSKKRSALSEWPSSTPKLARTPAQRLFHRRSD